MSQDGVLRGCLCFPVSVLIIIPAICMSNTYRVLLVSPETFGLACAVFTGWSLSMLQCSNHNISIQQWMFDEMRLGFSFAIQISIVLLTFSGFACLKFMILVMFHYGKWRLEQGRLVPRHISGAMGNHLRMAYGDGTPAGLALATRACGEVRSSGANARAVLRSIQSRREEHGDDRSVEVRVASGRMKRTIGDNYQVSYMCRSDPYSDEWYLKELKKAVEYKADVNAKEAVGETPLMELYKDSTSIKSIHWLLRNGGDPNIKDKLNANTIHHSVGGELVGAASCT